MEPSSTCFDVVNEFEGCPLVAYDDARPEYVLKPGDTIEGTLTIGRGHTGKDVHIGLMWTQEHADAQTWQDIRSAGLAVSSLVKVELTQGQLDALTDFVFQEGAGKFAESSLLRLVNLCQFSQVPHELCHQDPDGTWHGWVFAFGKPQPGIIRRRKAEIALWNGQNPLELSNSEAYSGGSK